MLGISCLMSAPEDVLKANDLETSTDIANFSSTKSGSDSSLDDSGSVSSADEQMIRTMDVREEVFARLLKDYKLLSSFYRAQEVISPQLVEKSEAAAKFANEVKQFLLDDGDIHEFFVHFGPYFLQVLNSRSLVRSPQFTYYGPAPLNSVGASSTIHPLLSVAPGVALVAFNKIGNVLGKMRKPPVEGEALDIFRPKSGFHRLALLFPLLWVSDVLMTTSSETTRVIGALYALWTVHVLFFVPCILEPSHRLFKSLDNILSLAC